MGKRGHDPPSFKQLPEPIDSSNLNAPTYHVTKFKISVSTVQWLPRPSNPSTLLLHSRNRQGGGTLPCGLTRRPTTSNYANYNFSGVDFYYRNNMFRSFTVKINCELLLSAYFIRKIGTCLWDSNTDTVAPHDTNAPSVLSLRPRGLPIEICCRVQIFINMCFKEDNSSRSL